MSACAWTPSERIAGDRAAEQMVAAMKQRNGGLNCFKYVGKLTLDDTDTPVRAFRVAVAARLPVQLRIDMLAPVGGSAALLASDGRHLYLVEHRSGKYYKKRFGQGSLRRFIGLDLSVGDLLELMAGRIPTATEWAARLESGRGEDAVGLILIDQEARVRQRIAVGGELEPIESVWYDTGGSESYRARLADRRIVGDFILPRRIEISGASGVRATVTVDRWELNAELDERLFAPVRPAS